MPTGRAWYVKETRTAWPHSARLCSGPFDDHPSAFAEANRLRPLYPDARLDVVLHTGRSMPERTPRSGPIDFDLRTRAGRSEASQALQDFASVYGARVVVEDWDGEPDVTVSVPALTCNIWLAWTPAAPMPIISWRALDGRSLVPVLPASWETGGTYKATSTPRDWSALFVALETGLCAGVDGTAFAS